MSKLLAKYDKEPNEKNILAIKKYLAKHPMAAIYLTLEQGKVFG